MLLRGVPVMIPPPGARIGVLPSEHHQPEPETPPADVPPSQQSSSAAADNLSRWTALGRDRPRYTDRLPPQQEAMERVDKWFKLAQAPGFEFPIQYLDGMLEPHQQHGPEQPEQRTVDAPPLLGLVSSNLQALGEYKSLPAQAAANLAYACQRTLRDGRRLVVDGDIYTGVTGYGEHIAHAVLVVDIAALLHLAELSAKGWIMLQPLDVLTSLMTAACGLTLADPGSISTPVRSMDDVERIQGRAARFTPFAFSSHHSLGGEKVLCHGLGDVAMGAAAGQAAAEEWIKQGCPTASGTPDRFMQELDLLARYDEGFKDRVGRLVASGWSRQLAVDQALRELYSFFSAQ